MSDSDIERDARLMRETIEQYVPEFFKLMKKAKNENDRLRAENTRIRKALKWIAQQPCQNKRNKEIYTACTESDDCITEYCFPCYAKAVLGVSDDED